MKDLLGPTLLLLACSHGFAETITFTFEGAVSAVPDELDTTIEIGDPISGHYSFGTDAVGAIPSTPTNSTSYPFALTNLYANFGGNEISLTNESGSILVMNDGLDPRFGEATCMR